MKKLLRNKKGFTLIELIVVIAILAILALILVPSIIGYIDQATEAKDVANARSLYSEVVLGAATGTLTASDTSASLGNTDCTFAISGESVSDFACTVDGDSLTLDFISE